MAEIKVVRTFDEVVQLVKKGNYDYTYQPQCIDDLPQVGPRACSAKGEPASRGGDFMMRDFVPKMDNDKCTQCGTCWVVCPLAIVYEMDDGYFEADEEFCRGCGICAYECPAQAIEMVRVYK